MAVRRVTGNSFKDALKLYSFSDYKHPFDLLVDLVNDLFIAPGFADIEQLSKQTPAFFYRFDWPAGKFGAFHGLDIPFVFGNHNPNSRIAKKIGAGTRSQGAAALSEKMMSYYSNFAKSGDPNGPGLPPWPQYTVEKKERIYFNDQITVGSISDKDLTRYQYWSEQNRNKHSSAGQ
jgi:para-nitrobenzyl esterase